MENDGRGKRPVLQSTGKPSPRYFEIDFYSDGVEFFGASLPGGRPPGSGSVRGKIQGWSRSSRRRMREFMISHGAPSGWSYVGYTLTIPGEKVPSVEISREMFRQWGQTFKRSGAAAVWRLEVQPGRTRAGGFPHWHLMAIIPPGYDIKAPREMWFSVLDRLLPLPYNPDPLMKRGGLSVTPRGGQFELEYWGGTQFSPVCYFRWRDYPGVSEYNVKIEPGEPDNLGPWKRYLQDHQSKQKQDQVASAIPGRHWGVIGRDRFVQVAPVGTVRLSCRQYYRLIRWQGRLATPYFENKTALFGRRRGYTPRRGRTGSAVSFTSPGTINEMVLFIRGKYTPLTRGQ